MSYLADVNLWLALAFESHVHHASASLWFDGLASDEVCLFCRFTQIGFLRLATNPKAFGEEAVGLSDAWRLYDMFRADPRVKFADEPTGIEVAWREFTARQSFSPKVWNDAYLAAFVQATGMQFVTFDQGFSQYADVACKILQ
jgi:hypothetical protein